jgi:glycosyltransferase involved in cell wall biosynthesis
LKILVIISTLTPGGAERVVSTLTKEWSKQHTVSIAVFDAKVIAYPYGGDLVSLSLPASKNRIKKIITSIRRIIKLFLLVQDKTPDKVISFMESANIPAIIACFFSRRTKCLIVSTRNNPHCFTGFQKLSMRCLYSIPNKVVAVSQGVADSLANLGIEKSKIKVIYNPVDIAYLKTEEQYNPAAIYGRYILAAGRLVLQKGFDKLILAFSKISDTKVKLIILGEGELRLSLEKQIKDLQLDTRVLLPGVVNNIAVWFKNAECFVLSSYYEGCPNVLLEAMSNGCPIVSFDCPYGPSEILQNSDTGILVENGNINTLKTAIETVINNKALQERLKLAGLKRAQTFCIKDISAQWLTLE